MRKPRVLYDYKFSRIKLLERKSLLGKRRFGKEKMCPSSLVPPLLPLLLLPRW